MNGYKGAQSRNGGQRAPEVAPLEARPAQTRYLHLIYLNSHSRQNRQLDQNQFVFKINRFLAILIGGYICDINLLGTAEGLSGKFGRTDGQQLALNGGNRSQRGTPRPGSRFNWISKFIFILCIGTCGLIADVAISFYINDYYRLRLARLRHWISLYGDNQPVPSRFTSSSSSRQLPTMRTLETDLVDRLRDVDSRLIIPGSIVANFGMLLEYLCVYICSLVFYVYCVPRLIFNLITPFDVHPIRDLLTFDQEQERSREICRKEVERFIRSNQQYQRNFGRAQLRSGSRACHLVTKILQQGALMLMNKLSINWMERRNKVQFWIQFAMLSYLVALDCIGLFCFVDNYFGYGGELNNQRRILVLVSIISVLFIVALSASFLMSVLFIYCWDMMKSIETLRRLVYDCIEMNDCEIAQYQLCSKQTTANVRTKTLFCPLMRQHTWDRINANFLFVLMTFKILMVQLEDFKRTIGPTVPVTLILALFTPIFTRLHVPYFNAAMLFHGQKYRWYLLLFSLSILLAVNFLPMVISYVHNRCLHLYRALASLLAHISRVQQIEPNLFDASAVASLRKELLKPDHLIEKFTIRSLGTSVTLSNLVRFHFWWGIAALSIVVDGEPTAFEALFRDPFGVYTF